MKTILTIEDSVETQLLLKESLSEKYRYLASYNLKSAFELIEKAQIDLILLDLNLPDGLGVTLIDRLCGDSLVPRIPIVILSALSDVQSRVACLRSGADDFLVKPFEREELLARVEAVLRRGPTRHVDFSEIISDLKLDVEQQKAYKRGANRASDLNLTPIEFKILLFLLRRFGSEITRDEIRAVVWGETYISERNVDTHICKLRMKLADTNAEIMNRRGFGYSLKISEDKKVALQPLLPLELPAFGKNGKEMAPGLASSN